VTSIVSVLDSTTPLPTVIRAGQSTKLPVAVGCNCNCSWICTDCCQLLTCILVDCACPRTSNLSIHCICTSQGFANPSTCTVSQNIVLISNEVVVLVSVTDCAKTTEKIVQNTRNRRSIYFIFF